MYDDRSVILPYTPGSTAEAVRFLDDRHSKMCCDHIGMRLGRAVSKHRRGQYGRFGRKSDHMKASCHMLLSSLEWVLRMLYEERSQVYCLGAFYHMDNGPQRLGILGNGMEPHPGGGNSFRMSERHSQKSDCICHCS